MGQGRLALHSLNLGLVELAFGVILQQAVLGRTWSPRSTSEPKRCLRCAGRHVTVAFDHTEDLEDPTDPSEAIASDEQRGQEVLYVRSAPAAPVPAESNAALEASADRLHSRSGCSAVSRPSDRMNVCLLHCLWSNATNM